MDEHAVRSVYSLRIWAGPLEVNLIVASRVLIAAWPARYPITCLPLLLLDVVRSVNGEVQKHKSATV